MAPKTATGDEAAAIAAAVAQFEAELAAAPAAPSQAPGAWQRAALLEGVSAKDTIIEPGGAKWQS